jgi:hypothetical protein
VAQALALGRAAELLNRFPGMFAEADRPAPDGLVDEARRLAPDDARVAAMIAVATAGYATASQAPSHGGAQAALAAARAVDDVVLESSALDAACSAALGEGDVVEAHRRAQERVARLLYWRDEPAAGLELKDALHVAAYSALGAGDLATASEIAQRQHRLPFLRERRDLADDELAAPAALAGSWDEALAAGERFLADWTAAGRPRAAGRGLAPAAVALAHGLRGDPEARARWLAVLAEIRGVPIAQASRGSGYGELFEAMVLLHEGRPRAALDVLTAADRNGLYSLVFRQWSAAVAAEAAVLADAPDAALLLRQAGAASAGNPIATAITARAAALSSTDQAALDRIADDFARAKTPYQAARTRALAAGMPSGGHGIPGGAVREG